jgi:hypothetical protein
MWYPHALESPAAMHCLTTRARDRSSSNIYSSNFEIYCQNFQVPLQVGSLPRIILIYPELGQEFGFFQKSQTKQGGGE